MKRIQKSWITIFSIAGFLALSHLFCGLVLLSVAQETGSVSHKTVKELYQAACSSCHGVNGKGSPQSHVGFDTPLPDFTDCNFTSREPKADWIAIAHEGGPVRGFSNLMPAFGDALDVEELGLIIDYIKEFCRNNKWPPGEFNLPRLLITEKAYPEDEAVFTLAAATEGKGAVSNKIVFEKRFGARNQFEMIIPFGWRENELSTAEQTMAGNWIGGLGDIAVGAKRVFFFSQNSGTILSAAGEVLLPTGDSDKAFGKGTTVFEPFVSLGQILSSEFFLQAQAGLELPTNTKRAEREGFWRFSLGRTFTSGSFGRSWSPMLELLGARELVSGEKVQWDLVPQMQVTLNRRQHIMANFGVRLPVTDSGTRNMQLLFYILWDWFDGGLLEGW